MWPGVSEIFIDELKTILSNIFNLLNNQGVFVFVVDTNKNRQKDDEDYNENISVKTEEGYDLKLSCKNRFDELISYSFNI